MKNVCCDKVEQKSSCGDIEVGWLCEPYMLEREEFVFDAFVYFEPVQRFKNRSDVRRFWRSGDSTSKRVLDVLLYETVEDNSAVSCKVQNDDR